MKPHTTRLQDHWGAQTLPPRCPPDWKGQYCQTSIFTAVASSIGIAIGVTVIILVLLVVLVYAARKKSNIVERLRLNLPSMPAMPSVPNIAFFRKSSPPNASNFKDPEPRQNSEAVPCMPLEETERKSYDNPAYVNGPQGGARSAPTTPLTPNGTIQEREAVCPVRGLAFGEPTTVWPNVNHPALSKQTSGPVMDGGP
ncbi:uncharacterized protein ACBT44_003078 [Syngnathus typhle]